MKRIISHSEGTWHCERQHEDQSTTLIGGPVAKVGGPDLCERVEFVIGTSSDWGPHGDEETEANARLIAASPLLLEALKSLAGAVEGFPDIRDDPGIRGSYDLAVAAIDAAQLVVETACPPA